MSCRNPAPLCALLVFLAGGLDAAPSLDVAALDAYVGDRVRSARNLLGIPGVAVSVVHEGRVVLLRGYGLADVATGRPVDPARTRFPIFSTSKAVTATAVMQLVEKGLVRLDDPVERHLGGLRLAGDAPGTVTVRDLLRQTSGLDETVTGLMVRPDQPALPLRAFLDATLPARLRPPGEAFQYSIGHNHTLLGLLLETVTGRSFDDVMEDSLLRPLGMPTASFRDPQGPDPDEALGYAAHRCLLGRPGPPVPTRIQVRPAGALRATAAEMARFMIAHLERGTADGFPMLRPETLDLMHARHHEVHPEVPGIALGFFHRGRILEHPGGPLPHFANLTLVPEARFGVFLAANTQSGALLAKALGFDLVERFFPDRALAADHGSPAPDGAGAGAEPTGPPVVAPDPAPGADLDLAAYQGVYRLGWYPHQGPTRLIALLPLFPEFRVHPSGPRELAFDLVGTPLRLHATHAGGDLFTRPVPDGNLAFQRDSTGRPHRLVGAFLAPHVGFLWSLDRIAWIEGRAVQLPLLVGLTLALLLAGPGLLLSLALRSLARRLEGEPVLRSGSGLRPALLASLAAWVDLALLAVPLVSILDSPTRWPGLVYGLPGKAAMLLSLWPLSPLLAGVTTWIAVRSARRATGSVACRLALSFTAAVTLIFVPFAFLWGLYD